MKKRTLTTEHKINIGLALKGRTITPNQKRKISLTLMGHKVSCETRKKMSEKLKGRIGTFKGKHHTVETKRKLSEIKKGNKNAWKGGITPENKLLRVKFRQTIQKQVFIRDNYTCQICGEKGGHLQVDHIQKWSEYTEGRFDINNCRTLCMSCHYKITFGRLIPENINSWGRNLKATINL